MHPTEPMLIFFESLGEVGSHYHPIIRCNSKKGDKSNPDGHTKVDGMHFDFRTRAPEYKGQLKPSAPPASPDMVYREFPNEVPRPQW